MRGIAAIFLTFCAFLLGVAGTLFNWVVVKTVFQFSQLIGNSPGLLLAWSILRDIGNMLLLFGFIFMGIATILNIDKYAAKNALPKLIIFAVLMNFSLFAAEAVIDASNGLSAVVYNQANTDPCFGQAGEGTSREDCSINYGIAGHIMQSSGISSIFAFDTSENFTQIDTTVLLGLSVLSLIAASVLFAASIMLIIRAVTLTFLMVLAPLGFAGMALAPLHKLGKKWWDTLLNQALFAPAMILLIFISLKITDDLAGFETRQSLAAALTNANSGVMGVIMVFALVIGFLIASLYASKQLGAMGASFAVKTAGSITYGSTAWVGRRTAGRASAAAGARIRNSRIGETDFGRRLAGVADRGAKASFDFRSTKAAGALGKQIGDLGKGNKGGFRGEVDAEVKKKTEYAKSLGERDMTEKEYQERLDGITKEREELNKHKSAFDDAKAKREKEQRRLDFMLERAKENPNDEKLKEDIVAKEKEMQEIKVQEKAAQERVAKSEKKIKEDTERLEKGRELSAKERRDAYADRLARAGERTKLRGLTRRSRIEAAKKIKGNKTGDKYDEIARVLREEEEKEKKKKEAEGGDDKKEKKDSGGKGDDKGGDKGGKGDH